MAMFKPNQSHSGGVTVNPYTGNIAQELQFLSGKDRKKNPTPIGVNQLVLLNFNLPNEMFKRQKRFREREDVKYFGKSFCVRRFAASRFGFHFFFHVRRGYHELFDIKEYHLTASPF